MSGAGEPKTEPSGADARAISLVRVSKRYERGGTPVIALRDASLDVARGEFCVLMGPSGCGKSTLLNLVSGLDRPTSGEIFLDGLATNAFTDADWTRVRRRVVGMVFQAFHLLPGLTVSENVTLPLSLAGVAGREAYGRVAESLEAVGLGHRSHHRPSELSGGEQQRVAIARALVHRPSLILADEPTGNLDSASGEDVIALLRSLPDRFGQTVLLVTHSVEAARRADRVCLMRDGRIVG